MPLFFAYYAIFAELLLPLRLFRHYAMLILRHADATPLLRHAALFRFRLRR